MLKKGMFYLALGCVLLPALPVGSASAWQCEDARVAFVHHPSDYYGSGEYVSECPAEKTRIRCYHYHRHWICEMGELYFWDRNLESAARTACGCPLPDGVAPSAPAVSKNPGTRIHGVPAP